MRTRFPVAAVAVTVFVVLVVACRDPGDVAATGPSGATPAAPSPAPSPGATGGSDGAAGAGATATGPPVGSNDPSVYAGLVARRAREAGVAPWLVMAVLYNESYKPHDPAFERRWQQTKPGASFGVANMHRAAFEQTRRGRAFADREWEELPDDPDLAITSASWYLRDLGDQLPAHPRGGLSAEELAALGYNTGPGNMRAFARGVPPGPAARSYLDRLRSNRAAAQRALAGSG